MVLSCDDTRYREQTDRQTGSAGRLTHTTVNGESLLLSGLTRDVLLCLTVLDEEMDDGCGAATDGNGGW